MGKHSINKKTVSRNAAIVAAVGAGVATMNPTAAVAEPVNVPNSNYSVDVPDEVMHQVKPFLDQAQQQFPAPEVAGQDAAPASSLDQAAAAPAAPAEGQAPAPEANPLAGLGQQIADAAMGKVGSPYVWGAAGPSSFDCSGLTSWAYNQVGKSIPRTSDAQAASGTPVSLDALQPGDIVSYYGGASHVAIYIGDGKVVQALNESSPVRVDDLHYMPVNNAVRF